MYIKTVLKINHVIDNIYIKDTISFLSFLEINKNKNKQTNKQTDTLFFFYFNYY